MPIYYLMGEEAYYIDRIEETITNEALTADERDFNLTILYGPQTNGVEVVNAAKRYPMMAERQVVVVREAQRLDQREALMFYAQHPLQSTVLVVCHKEGTLDRRTKLMAEMQKVGVVFESRRLYDRELPAFVNSYARQKQMEMAPEAVQILCEHVGSDLCRLATEMDKLAIAAGKTKQRIDAALIEACTGISKDYNSFELVGALVERDVMKANRIVNYFDSNPKGFALQPTLATLFKFFSDLMLAHYAPDKSERGLAAWLGQSEWQVRKGVLPAMRAFSAMKVFNIIAEIRRTDATAKGVGNVKATDGDLLKQLVFYILH